MQRDLQFPEELFSRDDASRLQKALEQWERPDQDILLDLLDQAAERPHTTACLLNFLHSHFTAEKIEQSRRLRQEKELGLLAWDHEDWAEFFRWEIVGGSCRILAYLGQDEDVLIPEEIEGQPVGEISQVFFLHASSIRRLLVPEGIRTGTILPREAHALFGKQPDIPEIIRLEREQPLPCLETPAVFPSASDTQPGGLVWFGRYAYGQDGSVLPISWQVLRWEAGRALLLASQALEQLPYHHNRSAVLWESCDLRSWLNETFLHAAFSAEEQALLLPIALSGKPNPLFRTRNSSRSQDKIFLLDPDEWTKELLEGGVSKTPWAARNDGMSAPSSSCPVWTRMPGLNTQYAVVLDKTQKPDYQGRLVNDNTTGVRPALWIRI